MNSKGFLLTDSLINILIVTLISLLTFMTFKMINNNEYAYEIYSNNTNEKYMELFNSLEECICQIEDSLIQEPS